MNRHFLFVESRYFHKSNGTYVHTSRSGFCTEFCLRKTQSRILKICVALYKQRGFKWRAEQRENISIIPRPGRKPVGMRLSRNEKPARNARLPQTEGAVTA